MYLYFINLIADYLEHKTLSTENEKLEGSALPSANNLARAKTSLKATRSLRQQYDNGYDSSHNYWKQKTEEDRLKDEAESKARRQDIKDQDIAIKQMWARRYAAQTLPLCPKPVIEFKEPGHLEPKKMICMHGNTFIVGTSPNCEKCQISNNLKLKFERQIV